MNDKRHPTEPIGTIISNKELGRIVSYMRYDQIIEFLRGFTEGTDEQARADRGRGYKKLSNALTFAAIPLNDLAGRFEEIMRICGSELRDEIANYEPKPFTIFPNEPDEDARI